MILQGDSRTIRRSFEPGAFHTCITSPPYFGLRDYGVEGQMGLEKTPEGFVRSIVGIELNPEYVQIATDRLNKELGENAW